MDESRCMRLILHNQCFYTADVLLQSRCVIAILDWYTMVFQTEYNCCDNVKSTDHSNSILTSRNTLAFCIQKPAFANNSATDELSAFLQQCKETPSLDMFSSENSMDVTAAMVWLYLWFVVASVLQVRNHLKYSNPIVIATGSLEPSPCYRKIGIISTHTK